MRKPGKTNIRLVAEAAGVSPATASRALNGNAFVSEELVQRVLSAAQSLGYPVNGDVKMKKNIVFIMPGISNTYYSQTVTGVLDVVEPLGYRVQIMLSNLTAEKERFCLQKACAPDTAGIIIAPVTSSDPRAAAPALASLPIVVTGPRHLADDLIHVHLDHVEMGYQSTRYLLRLGRKSIAFVIYRWAKNLHNYEDFSQSYQTMSHGCFTCYDSFTGYCRALEEAGIQMNPSLLAFGGMDYQSGVDCAKQFLCSDTHFDAVIAPNDRCGAGILNSLQAQGFHVPSHISLLCLDSDLIAKVVSPSLTGMASANYEIGQHCAYQLLHLINGEPAENVSISPKLLIESSTQFTGQF